MSSIPIYKRQLTRDASPDKDEVADEQFRKANFTDAFGQFLQQNDHANIRTFDDLVTIFWAQSQQPKPTCKLSIFAIADGAFVDQSKVPGGWFKPHLRFLALVTLSIARIFIVGPDKVKATDRFLQVASWDGVTFRFYSVEGINGDENVKGWTYQGNSFDAFTDNSSNDSSYLGPFNGHVNGACIMKELHDPWYHWYSGKNPNFLSCLTSDDQFFLETIPYLTGKGQDCFKGGSVQFANVLEPIIKDTVTNWYTARLETDFCDTTNPQDQKPKAQPSNVHRWMAHLLLTTTINIQTSQFDSENYTAPFDHFFNFELLQQPLFSDLLPDLTQYSFYFDIEMYKKARGILRLSLLQEVRSDDPLLKDKPHVTLKKGTLGGGKQTNAYDLCVFIETLPNTEGIPFIALQTSYEDAQGVLSMQSISQFGDKFPSGLLSDKAVQALLMFDFWNPIYSWRRGVLMQYLPQTTNLNRDQTYDLGANFIAAIRQSSFAVNKDKESPEYQFLQLYDGSATVHDYKKRFDSYLTAVNAQLQTEEGLLEYLSLAESRRRIYRPLPLDEFGVQLPYAVNLPTDWAYIEMTESGKTQPIPQRGLDFLCFWTGTLHGYDPHILPQDATKTPHTYPKPNASRCPMMKARVDGGNGMSEGKDLILKKGRQKGSKQTGASASPTWNDNIAAFFSQPYWVANPSEVGSVWLSQMREYSPPDPQEQHLDLSDRKSVERNAMTVYQHLRSKSMPITTDPSQYWPEAVLETFRLWVNQGFRETFSDPIKPNEIIPPPNDPPTKMRVRKDLLSLTPDELRAYREKLDDLLQVGSISSKWQELGLLHAEWCLHYQEATFLWHRAYLRYVEELIDFPIPYWNGFAADTSDPLSPHAGLPSIFLDQYYTRSNGEPCKNPLKYALSCNGVNKSGSGPYVELCKQLVDGPSNPLWKKKVSLFNKYHQQIAAALIQPTYSEPEAPDGYPWANLPAFSDDQPDECYPQVARQFFDGLFEQAHDNYHGWVGPDMADNTYTAFDPIFLSYHANMDRIVEKYLRAGEARQFTSNFPLRPFVNCGTALAYSDPRDYVYTTLGDMAKPTQALQYLYAPPATPDFVPIQKPLIAAKPSGGKAVLTVEVSDIRRLRGTAAQMDSERVSPYVTFQGVACMKDSFQIDVFVKGAQSSEPDPVGNPDYIGRITRLGMGPGRGGKTGLKNPQRCQKALITQLLDAGCAKERLQKVNGIQLVVTDLISGHPIEESEWTKWPGFKGRLIWG